MHLLESSEKCSSVLISRRDFAAYAAFGVAAVFFLPKPALASAPKSSTDYIITDDVGRDVRVPFSTQRIAPLGVPAQTVLTTLLPESISVLVTDISEDSYVYQRAQCSHLLALDCAEGTRSYDDLAAGSESGDE